MRGNELNENLIKSRNPFFQNTYLFVRVRAFFDIIVCVRSYLKFFIHKERELGKTYKESYLELSKE